MGGKKQNNEGVKRAIKIAKQKGKKWRRNSLVQGLRKVMTTNDPVHINGSSPASIPRHLVFFYTRFLTNKSTQPPSSFWPSSTHALIRISHIMFCWFHSLNLQHPRLLDFPLGSLLLCTSNRSVAWLARSLMSLLMFFERLPSGHSLQGPEKEIQLCPPCCYPPKLSELWLLVPH